MVEKTQVSVEELDPVAVFDYVLQKLALPKIGPLLDIVAPKTILKSLGIKTLDEITEDALVKIKAEFSKRGLI